MNFTLDCEQEEDGRWLAEVVELPGALAYGNSRDEAMAKAEDLRFGRLPNVWNMTKFDRSPFIFLYPPPREPMALG